MRQAGNAEPLAFARNGDWSAYLQGTTFDKAPMQNISREGVPFKRC